MEERHHNIELPLSALSEVKQPSLLESVIDLEGQPIYPRLLDRLLNDRFDNVWIIGLPGSGKTTLTVQLMNALRSESGDEIGVFPIQFDPVVRSVEKKIRKAGGPQFIKDWGPDEWAREFTPAFRLAIEQSEEIEIPGKVKTVRLIESGSIPVHDGYDRGVSLLSKHSRLMNPRTIVLAVKPDYRIPNKAIEVRLFAQNTPRDIDDAQLAAQLEERGFLRITDESFRQPGERRLRHLLLNMAGRELIEERHRSMAKAAKNWYEMRSLVYRNLHKENKLEVKIPQLNIHPSLLKNFQIEIFYLTDYLETVGIDEDQKMIGLNPYIEGAIDFSPALLLNPLSYEKDLDS